MTDTWAIDGTKANEEAARSPFDRHMRDMMRPMFNRLFADSMFDFGYEEPTEEDRETWRDRDDKERVFWADKLDLALTTWKYTMLNILKMHAPVDKKCQGCDFEGMESEPPEWPCRTAVFLLTGIENYHPEFYSAPLREKKLKDRVAYHHAETITIPIHTRRQK